MNKLISTTDIVRKYNISYQTLNYYTNLGLLPVVDKKGNKRLYEERQLRLTLDRINDLKKEGYTLRLIRKILSGQIGD
ncbi:MAG: MerR family transcriptional regulator [Candidatus Omnitrophica bacterium]|nr:MerR family transcriptional regulator [Candidatus Omnitrophota bacterium]